MSEPDLLRAEAGHMSALAVEIRDSEPGYADMLIERAQELLAEATAREEAEKPSPAKDEK